MRFFFWFMITALGMTVILHFFPTFDISISRLFFIAPTRFVLTEHPFAEALRNFMSFSIWILGIFLALVLILITLKKRRFFGLSRHQILFVYLCFLIGPGLIVNVVLKEHWGRARPSHIIELGGEKTFSAVFTPSTTCSTNCSFSSGEAALGFGFASFGLLRPRPDKRLLFLGLGLGLLMSLIRLMAGGHFMSDVAFSAGITLLFIMILHRVLIVSWARSHTPEY